MGITIGWNEMIVGSCVTLVFFQFGFFFCVQFVDILELEGKLKLFIVAKNYVHHRVASRLCKTTPPFTTNYDQHHTIH